jgi:hypothetical protein
MNPTYNPPETVLIDYESSICITNYEAEKTAGHSQPSLADHVSLHRDLIEVNVMNPTVIAMRISHLIAIFSADSERPVKVSK